MSEYERSMVRSTSAILVVILFLSTTSAVATARQAEPAEPERTWAKRPIIGNSVSPACRPVPCARQKSDSTCYLGRRVAINFSTGLLETFNLRDYLDSYGKNPRWPSGEYLGKFMQALSRTTLYTGDSAAQQRMDRIIEKWLAIQADDGWLGTGER
jgi:hypothetical protein